MQGTLQKYLNTCSDGLAKDLITCIPGIAKEPSYEYETIPEFRFLQIRKERYVAKLTQQILYKKEKKL